MRSVRAGDVSPNTNGTYCMDTGLPCDPVHSTCNGKSEMCVGRGPGKVRWHCGSPFPAAGLRRRSCGQRTAVCQDMFESTRIIAEKQFGAAKQLYDTATEELVGPVRAVLLAP